MRARGYALWPTAFGIGVAAEVAGRPPLPALDAATGFSLLAMGLFASRRRSMYAVGWIFAAAGTAWFLGTIAGWAVFLHRGPLAQLALTYPARRLWPASRVERIAIAVAYLYAIAVSLADSDVATIVFALFVLGVAFWRYVASRGPEHRARASALAAAVAFATALVIAAVMRLAGTAGGHALLAAYEITIMLLAAGLTADLLWGKWTEGLVTTMVIELGEPAAAGTLRDRLARTLGDPTLSVGYWAPDQESYVDESGRPLALPADDRSRRVKLIKDAGRPLVALIHDPAILDAPDLVADIAAATRLSVANARLQAQIRAQVAQVNASRRRLLAAADQQRHQLEHELREGAEQRLTAVADLLNVGGPQLAEVSAGLAAAQRELRELARGIHPATLTDHGLHAAINELATRSPVPVELSASPQRWPVAVEAGAYFVCSEALANVAKYARASLVRISITSDDTQLRVDIADDGIGGADPARGSGLVGLADRVEALGGNLTIDSQPGEGTRLLTQLPLYATRNPASVSPGG
jgi:signal transduction histidine kinase